MTFFLAALISSMTFSLAVESRETPAMNYRWEMRFEDSALTAKRRAADEQVAKLHTVKLMQWNHRGSLMIPSHNPESKVPTDVLYRMGVDALPALAEALDDETPTETVTHVRKKTKVWKVNDFASRLVWRIARRDFVLGESDEKVGIRDIAMHPKLAPEFRKQVIAWHSEFASKTQAERKIADLTDPWFRNRFDAAIWLGENKVAEARAPIAAWVDTFYANERRRISSLTRSEMSHFSLALGQIGDEAGLPQVRRVCADMSWWLETYGVRDTGMIDDLFQSYRGLTLLGRHGEAMDDLKRLFATCSPKMEETSRKKFERMLEEAKGW